MTKPGTLLLGAILVCLVQISIGCVQSPTVGTAESHYRGSRFEPVRGRQGLKTREIEVPAASSAIRGPVGVAPPVVSELEPSPPRDAKGDEELPAVECTTEPATFDKVRARPSGAVAGAVFDEELQTWNAGGRSDPNHVSNRPSYHPGTRVQVDVELRGSGAFVRSKAGASLARSIQARLRSLGYWPFRNCFEATARHEPDPGGKSILRLRLDGRGRVLESRLRRTSLKHLEIAKCQADQARRLRLEIALNRRVEIEVTASVWPGDLPLPAQPKVEQELDTMDLHEASQSVLEIQQDVIRCMRQARRRDPMLWGRLCLSFWVDENGRAHQIEQSESDFGDRDAVGCIAERLQTLHFPPSRTSKTRLNAAWRLQRPRLATVEPATPTSTSEQLD